jgi:hypothetical protein
MIPENLHALIDSLKAHIRVCQSIVEQSEKQINGAEEMESGEASKIAAVAKVYARKGEASGSWKKVTDTFTAPEKIPTWRDQAEIED